jgi:DNA-binding response OmpR family regulator
MPDLILMDIMMPDMDGYQALSIIKGTEELKKIPVIFISGLDSAEDELKGLSLQAADYITKPFSAPVVKLRVQNQIQLVMLHRELDKMTKSAESANLEKDSLLAKVNSEILSPLKSILEKDDEYFLRQGQEIKETLAKICNSAKLLSGSNGEETGNL